MLPIARLTIGGSVRLGCLGGFEVEEVQRIVGAILGVHEVKPDHRLEEDLEAESMDVVNIVAAIEERFEVTLPDEALSEVRTVAELVAVVEAARR